METPVSPAPALLPRRHWTERTWGLCKFCLWSTGALVTMYLLSAYVILPAAWRNYLQRHPALNELPRFTRTGDGIPGDPLNVALVGTEAEIGKIFLQAGWVPADAITMKSSLKIAHASVFRKAYKEAPVSNLFLWQRKQDLAYQYPLENVNLRHHVRFWKSEDTDDEGRPLWIGAATYDKSSGLNRMNLQVTHHIDADIDAERDKLFKDLEGTGYLVEWTSINDFHDMLEGRNGGGDPYHTDGHLKVGLIQIPDED